MSPARTVFAPLPAVFFLVSCLGVALPAPRAEAQGSAGAGAPALRVGTKTAPPFSFRGKDGAWTGLSIELWDEVAGQLGVTYTLEERDLPGLLSGLEDGSLDVAVAALTITADREATMDFTHPFYTSGLGIAVAPKNRQGWPATVRGLFSWDLLKALGALVAVLFLTGFLVWIFERRRNAEQFGGGPLAGLGSGFWWSAVTMTTVGYGDKAPVTVAGRMLALLWMFVSIVSISGFTAAIASSLTLARFELPVEGPEDLPRVRTAALGGSAAAKVLEARGIRCQSFGDVESALEALAAGRLEAVVHDAPILLSLAAARADRKIQVLPRTFERQDYGFGLPQGSPRREALNRRLLAALTGEDWDRLRERYLGE